MVISEALLYRYYKIAETATEDSLAALVETETYAYGFGVLMAMTNSLDVARAWLLGSLIRAASPEVVSYDTTSEL